MVENISYSNDFSIFRLNDLKRKAKVFKAASTRCRIIHIGTSRMYFKYFI